MAAVELLRVETDSVLLTIVGPTDSPTGQFADGPTTADAPLVVDAGGERVEVFVGSASGQVPWERGSAGPRFFEQTTYRVRIRARIDEIPVLSGRDPGLFNSIDAYPEDRMLSGTINFQRQVGAAQLSVSVGAISLDIALSVFPTKIDYSTDYQACVLALSGVARGLALEYMKATHRSLGPSSEGAQPSNLEWITILRDRVLHLERSMRYVNEHPHRILERVWQPVRADRLRRAAPATVRAIASGKGRGPWQSVDAVGPMREQVPAATVEETLDTPEHRFLRQQLTNARRRVATILQEHEVFIAALRSQDRDTSRAETEAASLVDMEARLNAMASLPVLGQSNSPPPQGFASLTMLHRPGYGEAYASLLALRLALGLNEGEIRASFSDVNDIYEAWCFIEVVRTLTSVLGAVPDLGEVFAIDSSGLRIGLRKGVQSTVSFEMADGRRGSVTYNKRYHGLTGAQKPDVVVGLAYEDGLELVLVLDAKYRLDASGPYLKTFGVPGPPYDAINALHRYRDAITVGPSGSRQRPVVRCAALFPLGSGPSENFASSPLWRSHYELGVGAIPFLPSNTGHLQRWLEDVLALPPWELSRPGPRFAGEQYWVT